MYHATRGIYCYFRLQLPYAQKSKNLQLTASSGQGELRREGDAAKERRFTYSGIGMGR